MAARKATATEVSAAQKMLDTAKASGSKVMEESFLRGKQVRTNITGSAQVGDVYTIPADCYKNVLGDSWGATDRAGNPVYALYIIVNTPHGGAARFYFQSCLNTIVQEVDKEGIPTANIFKSKGSAAEEYQKHANVYDALQALSGKTIVISSCENVRTAKYNGNAGETRFQKVFTANFKN